MKLYTLTLDTSVYINAFENPSQVDEHLVEAVVAAHKLRDAHEKNLVRIFFNGGEHNKKDRKKHPFIETRGPWILGFEGFSEAGVSTKLVSDELVRLVGEIINPPQVSADSSKNSKHTLRDFAILVEHIAAGRDVFVSEDKGHLKHAERLKSLNVIVMSTAKTVTFLEAQGIMQPS